MTDINDRLSKALAAASRVVDACGGRRERDRKEDGPDEALDALVNTALAEPPRGKLPALKVPDPEFLVDRLQDGKAAGLMSRRRRVTRIGDPQALVNEVGPVKDLHAAFVWAVVSQGGPVPVKSIADLDENLRSGLDQFTLEEFSTERDIYYVPLRLLVKFDPPLELKRPPPGRRFASEVDFSSDLAKAAIDPVAFANAPDVTLLSEATDAELVALRAALAEVFNAEFAGRDTTRARGVTREDVVNAHVFLLEELSRRGVSLDDDDPLMQETRALLTRKGEERAFAIVHGSGKAEHVGDPATLSEVLAAFDKPMALRMPVVYLVGGVANRGKSDNDIDLLIRGPFDADTEHVVKFRLGRALPPRLSERVQFLKDEMGPFTCHVPLYDLVLVPHSDRRVIEMRDVGKQDDPLTEYPSDNGKRRFVLQYHFRGKSLHADLRLHLNPKHLVGWTLAIQKPGTIQDVNTVAQARTIARTFDVEGSKFNKPLVLPSRVFAVPKSRQPVAWLTIGDRVVEPGGVGATRLEEGVYVKVLDGKGCEWGLQKPFSHEYFFSGDPAFAGVLFFRMLEGKAPSAGDSADLTPEGATFWTGGFTKSLLPGVLKRRAVETKSMPPVGLSAMPASLMQATPREFRFWQADSEKEAREVRDALVKERVFTESTVVLDGGGEFRLAARKVLTFPYDPDDGEEVAKADTVPFTLSWQFFKGQTVVRAAPTRQVWHLVIGEPSGDRVTDYQLQRDPLAGDAAIAGLAVRAGADLLKHEGDTPPGTRVGGLNLNPSKNTPSTVRIEDRGKVDVLENTPVLKRLRFKGGKLRGLWTLVAEEAGASIWQLSPGAEPARAVPEGKQAMEHVHMLPDDTFTKPAEDNPEHVHAFGRDETTGPAEEHEGGHRHKLDGGAYTSGAVVEADKVAKQTHTRSDGTQVWNPDDIRDDDDKGGDRAELRPPAVFQPMKPANRAHTEFSDPDEAASTFLGDTEGLVREGVIVEPKYNGFRAVIERWDAGVADGVKEGGVLIFTEDNKRPLQENLQGFASDVRALGGSFVIDGEIMGVDANGDYLPRRELARFRGTGEIDDSGLRFVAFDALYLGRAGNITQASNAERRRKLEAFASGKFSKSKRLALSPKKIVRTRAHLRAAIDWAAKQPGSEGAMLKQVGATYSLGGEQDLWGKVKPAREIRARVLDRHPVKGSPGVYNFIGGVGPIPASDADKWKDTVEAGGQTWVVIGRTGNKKLDAKPGDTILVETLELLFDEGPPASVTWFGPAQAMEVVSEKPFTIAQVRARLREGEVKPGSSAKLEKAERAVRILKADTTADTGGAKEERYVFGVVLLPDEVDGQGEIYSAEEVRKAAHSFMEFFGGTIKLMHRGRPVDGVKVLETYLTKQQESHGGESFPVGTWLMAVRVQDDDLWADVKAGDFTGFSIGGTALRERLQSE